jgi:glutaminyl-tRNA synthetase
VREDLNKTAKRAMAVLNPVKIIIDNYEEGLSEEFEVENNPENPDDGTRMVTFSKEVYIESTDFMEEPEKKYFRLSPGAEVRLKSSYYVTCTSFVKDETGEITEIHCTYDPESKGGTTPDKRRVKGTIHWVNANDCIDGSVNLYDQLFTDENPAEDIAGDFTNSINPNSLEIVDTCKFENSIALAKPGDKFQFFRIGYFVLDSKSFDEGKTIFNRTAGLKDSWAKISNKG